jgi:hypothetical protein
VPGYEASVWFGVSAPKTTSVAIIDKVNTETNAPSSIPSSRASRWTDRCPTSAHRRHVAALHHLF